MHYSEVNFNNTEVSAAAATIAFHLFITINTCLSRLPLHPYSISSYESYVKGRGRGGAEIHNSHKRFSAT